MDWHRLYFDPINLHNAPYVDYITDLDSWIKHLNRYKLNYNVDYIREDIVLEVQGALRLVFANNKFRSFKGIE